MADAQQGALSAGSGTLLAGARPLTSLSEVIKSVLERIHAEFGSLLHAAAASNDEDRKRQALSYLHSSRQQLLRLVSIVQWHPKAKALQPCVGAGQVLDAARQHAQMLEAATVELYEAHMRRQPDFSPMFDVQTALDVLSTGQYNDLPSSIEKLKGANQQSAEQQRRRLRRIAHLVSSNLLKVQLPEGLVVAEVREGWALLRAEGLYDARITLVPGLPLPEEPIEKTDSAANGVQGDATAGTSGDQDDDEVSSSKPATQRWRWLLLDFTIPVNNVQGSALHQAQVTQLLQDLNNRMHVAADAAVYAKRREQAAAAQVADGTRDGGPAGSMIVGDAAQPAPSHRSSAPQPSGMTSKVTGGNAATAAAVAAKGGAHHAYNLALISRLATDELSAPLAAMHSVLADVAGRLLIDAARAVAQQLAGPSGCWLGHAQVEPGTQAALELGFTVTFWTRAVPLLPTPTPAQGAATAAPLAGRPRATSDSTAQRPRLEIGMAPNGTVQVVTNVGTPAAELLPAASGGILGATGLELWPSCQQPETVPQSGSTGTLQLQLDATRVNVDELLLRAATALAWQELAALRLVLIKELQTMSIAGMAWEVHLTTSRTQCLPVVAQPVVDALTVQQAISPSAPIAAQAARMAIVMRGLDKPRPPGSSGTPQLLLTAPGSTSSGAGASLPEGSGIEQPQQAAEEVARRLEIEVEFPMIELWSQGEMLMRVSKSLFTGRLLLQPGVGGDANLQTVANWAAREDDSNNLLARIHQQPNSHAPTGGGGQSGQAPVPRVLQELAHRLAALFKEQQRSMAITATMTMARRLHLHLGGPSTRLMTAFHAERPWVDVKRFWALWSLPPSPFPPTFPPLYSSPPGTQPCMQPRSLSFVLAGDHPASTSGTYGLFVVACTDQMLPLKVLKVVPVPQHVYNQPAPIAPQPEQDVAAKLGRGASHASLPMATTAASTELQDMQHSGDMQVDTDVASGTGRDRLQSTSSSAAARRGHRLQRDQQQQRQQAGEGQGQQQTPVRDVGSELAAVVAWCHQRSIWEKLTCQLKALCAHFVEASLSDPDGGCILLQACAGIQLPCRIARRKGLSPPRVGVTRVTLSPGQCVESQQVIMVVQGCWFGCTSGRGADGSRGPGGLGNRAKYHLQHGRPPQQQQHQQQQQEHGPVSASGSLCNGDNPRGGSGGGGRSSSEGGGPHSGLPGLSGLRAQSASWRGVDTICLTYSLSHGHSVLDMISDLLSMVRMQTFLARLEAMAPGSMQLHVLHAGVEPPTHTAATDGPKPCPAPAAVRLKREREEIVGEDDAIGAVGKERPPPAKRARSGALANGHHPCTVPDGHQGNEGQVAQGKQQAVSRSTGQLNGPTEPARGHQPPQDLVWAWGLNGNVSLTSYGPTSATLQHTAEGGSTTVAMGAGAGLAARQHQHTTDGDSVNNRLGHAVVKKEQPQLIKQEQYPGAVKQEPGVGANGPLTMGAQGSQAEAPPISFTISWQEGAVWGRLRQASGRIDPLPAAATVGTPAATPQDVVGAAGMAAPSPRLGPRGTPLSPPAGATPSNDVTPSSAPRIDWSDLLACRVRAYCGSVGFSTPSSSASSDLSPEATELNISTGPMASFLDNLQQMAGLGEEGLLLDALAVAARPMHAAQAALDSVQHIGALGDRPSVVHIPGCGPFQHEAVIPLLGVKAGEGGEGTGATGGQQQQPCVLVLRVVSMAVGRSWLHLAVPSSWRGAAAFLTRLLHQLQEQLGQGAVHVASSWSQVLSSGTTTPRGTTISAMQAATGAATTRSQLWVLVENGRLEQAICIVLQGCSHPAPASAS